jgi:beta-ribofuranosylaminobenzene 5'-phosphate synthase
MIRITAPSRLHFGLLHVPTAGEAEGLRRFGGLGLMLRQPGVSVTVEIADQWSAAGPSAERALIVAKRVAAQLRSGRSFRIVVEICPPEHVGLGVGTQLSMAVAEAVSRLLGDRSYSTDELAKLAGRGERSRIGIEGYRGGGLLLDGGQPADAAGSSRILSQQPWPSEWRVLLLRPAASTSWHGDRERLAFARPRDPDANLRTTERLCRLALLGVLPALAERDLPMFGEALHEYNRLAGEVFADDQGGPYAGAAVTELITWLRAKGIRGVGQSSWGPTVFAMVESADAAEALLREVNAAHPNLESAISAEGY